MKKFILTLLAITVTLPTWADVSNDNFNFKVSIKKAGDFKIVINEKYAESFKIKSIIEQHFLRESNQKKADSKLKSVRYTNSIASKVSKTGTHKYTMVSKMSKIQMTATITNSCQLIVSSNKTINKCSIQKSNVRFIGSLFHNGSSRVECTENTDKTKSCKITLSGKVKGIDTFLVDRTADRLAISGTIESLHSTFGIYHNLINSSETNGRSTTYFKNNLSDLWQAMIAELNSNDKLDNSFTVYSTNAGYTIN
jgi:hypothetical protein